MVGVNPETAHETMAGLSFFHGVAQALWAGKLFHIDLNGQKIGRYDQDLRFGSEGIKDAFFLVKLLEEAGYDGPRHFDARPYRVDRDEGIWDFARGCMRTYLALAEKARRFNSDPQIQEALAAALAPQLGTPTVGSYAAKAAEDLKSERPDLEALAARNYGNERLDQLVIDLILGL
jgi:xylose isomerase